MNQIELKALAKINLGLDVLGRRENGYHDVRMVMQSIYLYDEVKIAKKKEPGITLTTNLKFLPTGDGNIAYKAAQLLMDEFDLKEGVQITLNKHIPVAAGLAGGTDVFASVSAIFFAIFGSLSIAVMERIRVSLGFSIVIHSINSLYVISRFSSSTTSCNTVRLVIRML